MIHFTLDIEPRPKGRPRVGSGGRIYTPQSTVEFESAVRGLAKKHISEPLLGALALEVLFVHPRLKSEAKKRSGRKYKLSRPDLSNLIKSLEDGLQGVAFKDDAQIVSITADKVHAALGESAHIECSLIPIPDVYLVQSSKTIRTAHSNAQGERGASASVVDADRPLTAKERRELKAKRREINRAEHRRAQEAKNKRLSKERSVQKLENAKRKLIEVQDQRRAEKEEQERAKELERARSIQQIYEQLRARRLSASQKDDDDDQA